MSKAMVVIPTYNEKENVETIASAVLALPQGFHLLIVDDNSPDGTGRLADRLATGSDRLHVLHRSRKQGIGPAYVDGFAYALRWGATKILQMDADFSHNPDDLPRLLEASEGADVVIGSRYQGGVRVLDWSARRLLLSMGASRYVRVVLGMPVADPTGGFKCFRRRVLESLDLKRLASRGYCFQIETTYRAWKKGFKIVEIPIVFTERKHGGSKIDGSVVYEALYILWRLRLQLGFSRTKDPQPLEAASTEREASS